MDGKTKGMIKLRIVYFLRENEYVLLIFFLGKEPGSPFSQCYKCSSNMLKRYKTVA